VRTCLLPAMVVALMALVPSPAQAQPAGETSRPRVPPPAKKNAAPAAPAKAAPPPANAQEKPLVDLSETIGALAFLTQICSPAASPNPWRVRMEVLIESEGDPAGARAAMTGAFNQGFTDYATTYRQCTDAARTARRVLTRDAARMARDLERRFGT
jgi:uncharacterized protein (TIGR02301 family)